MRGEVEHVLPPRKIPSPTRTLKQDLTTIPYAVSPPPRPPPLFKIMKTMEEYEMKERERGREKERRENDFSFLLPACSSCYI